MLAFIFDTETTGLPKHRRAKINLQPRIIEFGALLIDEDGNEHEEMNVLLDPEQEIEPIITKITGITQDQLDGQAKFIEVLPRIMLMAAKADIIIAHNLPFDESLLQFELQRCGQDKFPWPRIKLCTVQENRDAWGKRPKLTELYERVIGKPLAQTHRAIDDCRALAEIVIKENYIELIASTARANGVLIP